MPPFQTREIVLHVGKFAAAVSAAPPYISEATHVTGIGAQCMVVDKLLEVHCRIVR